ncbi:hypothetical protein FQZ97_959320 [compost metagenome]
MSSTGSAGMAAVPMASRCAPGAFTGGKPGRLKAPLRGMWGAVSSAGGGASTALASGCRRWYQLAALPRWWGSKLEITSRSSARVRATYSALSSSSARACCSSSSALAAQAGGDFSLARNTKRRGAASSPGQSTSTPMFSGREGPASVSSMSTVWASSPLAPWMVSRRTAHGVCTGVALMPPALSARTRR